MSADVPPPADSDADAAIARPLETALRARPLSEEAVARIRSAVENEWRERAVAPTTWRRWRFAAIAASVAMVLVGAYVWLYPVMESAAAGVVVRVDSRGLEAQSRLFYRRALIAGDTLRVGETLDARGPALLALAGGGTLRIAGGGVVDMRAPDAVGMREGQIYVDLPPDLSPARTFSVVTSVGVVEHLGTQFEVATIADAVRIRVREGQIRLRGASGTELAAAGTELLSGSSGIVTRRAVSTHGPEWSWVEAMSPQYTIENRPLGEFLQWAARETGYRLELVDAHALQTAAETRLHGSIEDLTPLDALAKVLSTTSLKFELRGDAIRVSSEH